MRPGRDAWHRHSIRLPGYDYSGNGAYFITICIEDRACLLGSISDGIMRPTDAGRMVAAQWEDLPDRFSGLALDASVVMPNHFHGVLVLDECEWVGEVGRAMTGDHKAQGEHNGQGEHKVRPYAAPPSRTGESRIRPESHDHPNGTSDDSLGRIIQAFKSLTTNAYTCGVQTLGWPEYRGRLWQRNYYDHIVRDEADLSRIRTYIASNPANWSTDSENPTIERPQIRPPVGKRRNEPTHRLPQSRGGDA